MEKKLGLIAGSGRLPHLVAAAAADAGYAVHAVAHRLETDADLSETVTTLDWVHVGQLQHIVSALKKHGITQVVMAGGIGRIRSLHHARVDLGTVRALIGLRHLRDDALLRAAAAYLEQNGVQIVSATDVVPKLLVPHATQIGPELTLAERSDMLLGFEVARTLGTADVGQTVVVKNGAVLALEAVEGTDETIRRGARYGGDNVVVVKCCKPGQDQRFDLPAIGPGTIEVMREVKARVLAVQSSKTILIDSQVVFGWCEKLGITLVAGEETGVG